jgi:GMP synthase (glutamine-hydrolysing)
MLQREGVMGNISQMPVVLLPVSFGTYGERSIVLRPFISPDFMTGKAAVPGADITEELIFEMARRIREEVPGISRVLIDRSSKPPGTTEWE